MTETSAATFVNLPFANYRIVRTVRPPPPGTEAIIAADGEILVRGPGVVRCNHNMTENTEDVLACRRLAAHRRHQGS